MKPADAALAARLGDAVTSLAELTVIRSPEGSVWRWTSAGSDLIAGTTRYAARPGVERSAILIAADLSVPSVELHALELAIDASVIDRGWVDGSDIQISVVDATAPGDAAAD